MKKRKKDEVAWMLARTDEMHGILLPGVEGSLDSKGRADGPKP